MDLAPYERILETISRYTPALCVRLLFLTQNRQALSECFGPQVGRPLTVADAAFLESEIRGIIANRYGWLDE